MTAGSTIKGTNLRIRLLASFLYRFLNTMTVPFMAIYLASTLGQVTAGLLMVVVAACAVVAALLGGPLCDRFGRRPMLLLGEFGTAVGFLGAAAGTSGTVARPELVYAFFISATTLYALVLPAHDATIVDVTTPESRKTFYTVNYWCINVAIGVGSLLGAFLYRSHFSDVLLATGLVLAGLGAVTAIFVTESLPDRTRTLARERGLGPRGLLRGYRIVITDRRYMLIIGAATLAISIELQLTNFIAVRLAGEFPHQAMLPFALPGDLAPQVTGLQMVGVLRTENTLLVVVLAIVLAPLLRRLPDRPRLVAGIAVFTAGFAVLAVSNTAWVLLLAVLVLTVGELANVPIKQALIANSVRPEASGSYLAAYGLTGNVGWVIATAGISLGAVIGGWGMAVVYVCLGLVSAWIFAAQMRPAPAADPAPDPSPTAGASYPGSDAADASRQ